MGKVRSLCFPGLGSMKTCVPEDSHTAHEDAVRAEGSQEALPWSSSPGAGLLSGQSGTFILCVNSCVCYRHHQHIPRSAPGEHESSPDSGSAQDTQLCVLDITLVPQSPPPPCLALSGVHFLA